MKAVIVIYISIKFCFNSIMFNFKLDAYKSGDESSTARWKRIHGCMMPSAWLGAPRCLARPGEAASDRAGGLEREGNVSLYCHRVVWNIGNLLRSSLIYILKSLIQGNRREA